ncbi:MAG TPA: GspE/PulE family protein, partial [Rhodocyclaceae bacterium]|nr:GspE/PulE family protein [Rhodocyclaceae bacterium]
MTVAAITAERIEQARRLARESRRSVMQVLEELLGCGSRECVAGVAETIGLRVLDMEALGRCTPLFHKWTFPEAVSRKAFVADYDKGIIGVLADPFDVDLQLRLEGRADVPLEWVLVTGADVEAFLARQEDDLRAMHELSAIQGEVGPLRKQVADISIASIADDSSPVVRMVNSTIYDAMRLAASDIHLETGANGLTVKVRVDGVLSQLTAVNGMELAEQVVSRVKVMAELDIGERRVPQDGRFKLAVRGREIDFRVSVMPSLFGEDVVIRILDKQSLTDQFQSLRLDLLGFEKNTLERVRQLTAEPYGMVLVTGPTGSGKTTTLYAALSEIHTGEDKIITIEDPIEYQLAGILQIPVNEKKGLGFARGLRSILRHDPDKILVGEIRDPETAQIAIQSALTGHLVFTSVHANNVFDVIGRFLHMGVDPYSFVSCLNGVLGQRLIRVICQDCAATEEISDEKLLRSGIDPEHADGMNLRRGRGCGSCRGTGYRGRIAIGEVLVMNDSIREMLVARAPISTI